MMRPRITTIMVLICVCLFATACEQKKKETPDTGESMQLILANEVEVEPCTCTGASVMNVVNPDTQVRFADVEIVTRDNQTNNIVSTATKKFIVNPGKSDFAGCTIDAKPLCKFNKSYRILKEARIPVSNSGVQKSFGPFYTPDIATCYAICSDPNDVACLRLGTSALPITGPLTAIYISAIESGAGTIPASEIMAKYNVTDNKCDRGDVTVTATTVENTNTANDEQGCKVSSDPAMMLLGSSVSMTGYIPYRLKGLREATVRIANGGEEEHLRFEDRELAPKFGFEGKGSDQLNSLYGGAVSTMSVVNGLGVFATANGCISAPTK